MEVQDLSGISDGNLEGIIEMKIENGWHIVRSGWEVYGFRFLLVGEA